MAMKIAKDCLLKMAYSIKDRDGTWITGMDKSEAMEFVLGYGYVLPKVEEALLGMAIDEEVQIALAAEDAYGKYRDDLVTRVDRSHFANEFSISVGMRFSTKGPDGNDMVVEVIEVEDDKITLDGNHPLAGLDLIFDIKILEVRQATEEEVKAAKSQSSEQVILH